MSLSKQDMAADYPLPAYNFRVDVAGVRMGFSEVSGISIERQTLSYRHGLSYWEGEQIQTYTNNAYRPVTLRKGVIHGAVGLHAWLYSKIPLFLDVHLCDAQNNPVITWHVAKALAVKLEAPGFDPNDNAAAVESLEIMASGIYVLHH